MKQTLQGKKGSQVTKSAYNQQYDYRHLWVTDKKKIDKITGVVAGKPTVAPPAAKPKKNKFEKPKTRPQPWADNPRGKCSGGPKSDITRHKEDAHKHAHLLKSENEDYGRAAFNRVLNTHGSVNLQQRGGYNDNRGHLSYRSDPFKGEPQTEHQKQIRRGRYSCDVIKIHEKLGDQTNADGREYQLRGKGCHNFKYPDHPEIDNEREQALHMEKLHAEHKGKSFHGLNVHERGAAGRPTDFDGCVRPGQHTARENGTLSLCPYGIDGVWKTAGELRGRAAKGNQLSVEHWPEPEEDDVVCFHQLHRGELPRGRASRASGRSFPEEVHLNNRSVKCI